MNKRVWEEGVVIKARDVCVFVHLYEGQSTVNVQGEGDHITMDVLASAIRLFVLYG
jgi:hypothetical protein